MTSRYGYAPRGERAVDEAPKHGAQNLTLLAGISLCETHAPRVLTGSLGGSEFLHRVREDLVPTLWRGAVLILDDLSTHSVAGVREAVKARGARLLSLPPYSPDLNPIVHCWSKIKMILRRLKPRSIDTFLEAVATALKAVSFDDIGGWLIHCRYQVVERSITHRCREPNAQIRCSSTQEVGEPAACLGTPVFDCRIPPEVDRTLLDQDSGDLAQGLLWQ